MESIRITEERMKVILPKEVQDSDALSDNEKKTLAAVMNYYAFFDKVKQQGYVYLSNKLLRGSVGIRQHLLLEAIQGLIEHGLIKREAGDASHRLASKYYVLWDNLKKPIKKLESDDIFASFYKKSEPSETPMGTTDIDTDIDIETDTDIVIEKEKEIDTVSVPVQEAVIETVPVSVSEIVSDSYLNNSLERKRSYIDNPLQEENNNLSLNNSLERKEDKDSNNVNVEGDTVPVKIDKKDKRKRSSTLEEDEDFGGIADSNEYSTQEARKLKQQLLEDSNVEIVAQRFLQPGSLMSIKVCEYKKKIEDLQSLKIDGVRKYTDVQVLEYVTLKAREDTALSSEEVVTLIDTLSRELALHTVTP